MTSAGPTGASSSSSTRTASCTSSLRVTTRTKTLTRSFRSRIGEPRALIGYPPVSAELIGQSIVLGILTGGVYALMASGLTLIFGVMRVVNVAHGALVILGAYLSFVLWRNLSIDPFVSLVVTMPVMFVLGVILQVVFIRPLKTDR